MVWLSKFFSSFSSAMKTTETEMHFQEKRTNLRTVLPATKVDVTDGCISCTASLLNVSSCGVCLTDLPENLYSNSAPLTLFGTKKDEIPVIQISPQWVQNESGRKAIGASIINPPEKWLHFIKTSNSNH